MPTPTNASLNPFYGAKTHLLGGIAKALTDGKVDRVEVSGAVATGMAEFDLRTGKVRRIVLPREENLPVGFSLDAARGLMDHEDAHALFTTTRPEDGKASPLVKRLTNILEDPRVETLKGRRYPGAKEHIDALTEIGLRITGETLANPAVSTLEAALRAIALVTYEADLAPVAARRDGRTILAFLDAAGPCIGAALASPDTAGVMLQAERIEAMLKLPPTAMPTPAKGGKGQGGKAAPEDSDEAPETGGKSRTEETEDERPNKGEDADATESSDDQPGKPIAADEDRYEPSTTESAGSAGELDAGIAEDTEGLGAPSDEPIWTDEDEAGLEGAAGITPAEIASGLLAPALEAAAAEAEAKEAMMLMEAEKSGLLSTLASTPGEFMAGMVVVPLVGDAIAYRVMAQEVRTVTMGVKNALRQHLLAEGRTRFRSDREQGFLDPKALYKVAARIPVRPFRDMQLGRSTKTAVTLLVDESGSMSGSPIHNARLAATALCEALQGLPGIQVEVLGFTTGAGAKARHSVAKPFGSRNAAGIASLAAQSGNADGAALRWAALRLLQQRVDRRILLVLSDGDPTEILTRGVAIYVPSSRLGATADQDLRAAVAACERHGVETVGIGIKSSAVQRFYPKHVVIESVEGLKGEVLRQLVGLLKPRSSVGEVA